MSSGAADGLGWVERRGGATHFENRRTAAPLLTVAIIISSNPPHRGGGLRIYIVLTQRISNVMNSIFHGLNQSCLSSLHSTARTPVRVNLAWDNHIKPGRGGVACFSMNSPPLNALFAGLVP